LISSTVATSPGRTLKHTSNGRRSRMETSKVSWRTEHCYELDSSCVSVGASRTSVVRFVTITHLLVHNFPGVCSRNCAGSSQLLPSRTDRYLSCQAEIQEMRHNRNPMCDRTNRRGAVLSGSVVICRCHGRPAARVRSDRGNSNRTEPERVGHT
jgi:hypothetical protein